MEVLARVVTEMSCGEALEFQYAYDLDVTEAQYEEVVRAKTGSLIGAATEIGAGRRQLRGRRAAGFREFGERLGVAFQVVDDLFDYLGDPDVTGKPVGGDLADGKITLPLIAALREATETDARRIRRLATARRRSAAQWTDLRGLIERAGGFAYARSRADALAADSLRLLDRALGATAPRGADAVRSRRALEQAVDYAVRRDH
jgi:octaprenyl-diphosphate synthase